MSSGKGKAPAAPDPIKTAEAQTGTNVSTAIANSYLNNFDQVGPDGSITFQDNGYEEVTDPSTGQTYRIPKRTAVTTLSESQQAIKDQNDAAQLGLATLANDQTEFLQGYLSEPVDLSNSSIENYLYDLASERLDPQLERQREGLENRLAQQGITIGTEAYDRAMEGLNQSQNDARNRLLLDGRGQAVSEMLAARNQPINEITALLSGSQVSNPTAQATAGSSIPTTDVAGLINADYQNRLAAHNAQMAGRNSIIGTIGNVAANAIALSDERVKKDKKKVGETADGITIYDYLMKGEKKGSRKRRGVMAQEAMKKRPEAVSKRPDGLYQVDYSQL